MKVYVTGAEGNIGKSLIKRGCYPLSVDVTDGNLVQGVIGSANPDLIIHCAALTDVDYCEDKKNERSVESVNYWGTVNVLKGAEKLGIPVVVLSSDHVFDGKHGNYLEQDAPKPVNFYGMSKSTMEAACGSFANAYIVRTSALFDRGMKDCGKYEAALLSGEKIEVPTVLYRTFCHVSHFVDGLLTYCSMVYRKEQSYKIIHISGTENISWFELIGEISDYMGWNHGLIIPRSRNDSTKVPRPLNGGLNTRRAASIGIPLYSFMDGIRLAYGK